MNSIAAQMGDDVNRLVVELATAQAQIKESVNSVKRYFTDESCQSVLYVAFDGTVQESKWRVSAAKA